MWVSAARAVVPLILVAGLSACDADAGPRQADPSPVTPTPTPSPSPTSTPTPPSSPFAALPRGHPPAVGYVDGYVHISPGGARTRLPRGRGISQVTPYLDGFVVSDAAYFEGTNGTALVTEDGREEFEPCTSGGGAVGPDEQSLVWATFGCPESSILSGPSLIHRRTASGDEVQEVHIAPNTNSAVSVAGIVDDDVVFNRVFPAGAFITDLVNPPRPIPGLRWASSIDEVGGRIAGQAGRFGVVVDPTTGDRLWELRGTRLTSFSPRGRSIVATSGRSGRVLDARTGLVRYSLQVPDRVYLGSFAWEDEQHLLAVAGWRLESVVLRFDAQGRVELATPVSRRRGWVSAYVLDSQP